METTFSDDDIESVVESIQDAIEQAVDEIERVEDKTEAKTTHDAEKKVKTTMRDESKVKIKRSKRDGPIVQVAQIVLRLLVVVSAAAACMIVLFTKETGDDDGFLIRASYRISPALKFFVSGTAVVAVYNLISVVVCLKARRCVRILDMMMMSIALASASAVTALGYVAVSGNGAMGWVEACSFVRNYCIRSAIAVAFAYFGFLCHFVVCALSSDSRKRKMDHSL